MTEPQHPDGMANANFPKDQDGRVYHVGVKKGEVANRVLTVGSGSRAHKIGKLLDDPVYNHENVSTRGFVTVTGLYNGVPVTVLATGMGYPMIDMMVREVREVVEGDMAMVRYGTCGVLRDTIAVGSIVVATESNLVRRNPDAFGDDKSGDAFSISKTVKPHQPLADLVQAKFKEGKVGKGVYTGGNATADSFYSSQGRLDPNFDDSNADLIDKLLEDHPTCISLEMETFHLFDLARCSRKGRIYAGASAIALAQRKSNEFLSKDELGQLEVEGGRAVLEALTAFPLEHTDSGPHCVWEAERPAAKKRSGADLKGAEAKKQK